MAQIARKHADILSELRLATNLPGQVMRALQGGAAPGAYQVGVFQDVHEVAA